LSVVDAKGSIKMVGSFMLLTPLILSCYIIRPVTQFNFQIFPKYPHLFSLFVKKTKDKIYI
jgi:hypothetical protein